MSARFCVRTLVVVAVFVATPCLAAKKLLCVADGFNSCPLSEPDYNACALKRGREALPLVVKGLPAYQVAPFDPLHIDEIRIDDRGNTRQVALALTMMDIDIFGLANAELLDNRVDFKELRTTWDFRAPQLSLIGRYNASGRVLILPISGYGPMNITLENVFFQYTFKMSPRQDKDGIKYFHPKDTSLNFNTTRAHLSLQNLFNGDKRLSQQMNVFLNENWREMIAEVGPPVAEGLNVAVTQSVSNLARVVPYDVIFPA